MSEELRPRGLTALAILNFVFGGLTALNAMRLFGMMAGMGDEGSDEIKAKIEQAGRAASTWLGIVFLFVAAVLLIVSGLGYLEHKKIKGRIVGIVYGIFALASTVVGALSGGDFNILSIIGLVYPVLTLVLVNTVFKSYLVR